MAGAQFANLTLRPATPADRPFVEGIYFETQRWLIEKLFGWRGDEFERAKFDEFYDKQHTQIVQIDGEDVGWLTVLRESNRIEVDSIYIAPERQGAGLGTLLMEQLIAEAAEAQKMLTLSTAKVNPARRLYERLGFEVVNESEFKVYMERKPEAPMNRSIIRKERSDDVAAIRAVHDAAFGRDAEGRLVDHLRADSLIVASVVAVIGSEIVANAAFSRLTVRGSSGSANAAALAPVAVTPAYQRRGLGSMVISEGLRLCAAAGFVAVFVLGDPAYYERFGFSHDLATAVRSPYSAAGQAWMALELQPSSIFDDNAELDYPNAFAIVD